MTIFSALLFFTKDLKGTVVKIAHFLDRQLSNDAIELTVRHCSFQSMKNNPSANPDFLDSFAGDNGEKKSEAHTKEKPVDENASFIRKGEGNTCTTF